MISCKQHKTIQQKGYLFRKHFSVNTTSGYKCNVFMYTCYNYYMYTSIQVHDRAKTYLFWLLTSFLPQLNLAVLVHVYTLEHVL